MESKKAGSKKMGRTLVRNNFIELRKIKSLADATELDKSLQQKNSQCIFRGYSNEALELIPRIEWEKGSAESDEQINFINFKQSLENQGYFKQDLIHNDFRTLGLAQHYERFPTRLLDWTRDILIALYFACRNKDKHNLDGAIWLFPLPADPLDGIWLTPKEENGISPFNLNEFKVFICGSFVDDFKMLLPRENEQDAFGNDRDGKQRSVMTLHPKNRAGVFGNLEALKQKYDLEKILVPKEFKPTILNDLSRDPWRITHETLFNGLSARELINKEILKNIVTKNLRDYDSRALANRDAGVR